MTFLLFYDIINYKMKEGVSPMQKLDTYNAMKQLRGSWNGVNPVTKVIPNKKKNANKKLCRKKIDL